MESGMIAAWVAVALGVVWFLGLLAIHYGRTKIREWLSWGAPRQEQTIPPMSLAQTPGMVFPDDAWQQIRFMTPNEIRADAGLPPIQEPARLEELESEAYDIFVQGTRARLSELSPERRRELWGSPTVARRVVGPIPLEPFLSDTKRKIDFDL